MTQARGHQDIVKRDPRVGFFLLFLFSLRLSSARSILNADGVNLTFAALSLTFRFHEAFFLLHLIRRLIRVRLVSRTVSALVE